MKRTLEQAIELCRNFTQTVTNGARDLTKEVGVQSEFYGHPHDRLLAASGRVRPFNSKYRVVYENPSNGAMHILIPSPQWMGAAMAGDIIDTIEVHLMQDVGVSTSVKPCPKLTEEQAVEYLLVKDVLAKHPELLDTRLSNRLKYRIVTNDSLPTNRDYRDALALNQEVG